MRAVRVLSLLFAISLSLLAQAWLSPKGDGVVTLFYQNDIERLHSFGDGRTKDRGHTYLDAVFERSRKRQAEPERGWMRGAVWACAAVVCRSSGCR